jgi:predicted nucleic acid-binding protein
MKGNRVFIDTNIIIYAYDVSAGKKHEIAEQIYRDLWDSGGGVISSQVLQEFFVNVTQKIPNPLDTRSAKEIITDLLRWDVIVNDGESITDAIDIHSRFGFSFWDSLIVSAALKGGVSTLQSEDLSHKQVINGLTILNPFQTN